MGCRAKGGPPLGNGFEEGAQRASPGAFVTARDRKARPRITRVAILQSPLSERFSGAFKRFIL